MQFFKRDDVAAPQSLTTGKHSSPAKNLLVSIFSETPARRSQSRISMAAVTVETPDVSRSLSKLFKGRCAFCESKEPIRPYRFRPTEEAGPSGAAPGADAKSSHLYYCWLTNSWQNIYAICAGCYPLEPSIFPVIGKRCHLPSKNKIIQFANSSSVSWPDPIEEKPVFLDPCETVDLRPHLAALPTGELVGLSPRGQPTIDHFNLNRSDLVERRKSQLRSYLDTLLQSAKDAGDLSGSFDFQNLEFGGGWYLLLYQMAMKLGDAGGTRPVLSTQRISNYYVQRLASGGVDFRRRMMQAFENLRDVPAQLNITQRKSRPMLRGESRPVKFEIKNFKALEYVEIALRSTVTDIEEGDTSVPERAPALVILGENAAGKSSILEAMALVLSSKEVRNNLSLDPSQYRLNPAYMGATRSDKERDCKITVTYENGSTASVRIGEDFPFVEGEFVPRIPVFAYGAFRMYSRDDRKASRRPSPIRSLFEAEHILANPEKWLASIADDPVFEEVSRALKFVLAVEQDVDIISVDPKTRECFLVLTSEMPDREPLAVRTPLKSVSSGFRSVLAMACDVMRGLIALQDRMSASLARARAVVLIDEVEAHLHPKWKMRIIHGLRRALPNVTFIFSTHDPLCLRGLSSDDVRVFRRLRRNVNADSGKLPSYVEQINELPAIGILTIEQLLTSDLFQLHSTDSPDIEDQLARAGDILARASGGTGDDQAAAAEVRAILQSQIGKALPIGSSEVEQLVQEAVEAYLVRRRETSQSQLSSLRDDTRVDLLNALGRL